MNFHVQFNSGTYAFIYLVLMSQNSISVFSGVNPFTVTVKQNHNTDNLG